MRIKSLLLAGLLLLSMTGCSNPNDADNGKMRKDMTAMEYAKDMGVGINLGNTMESYWASSSCDTSGASVIGENTPQNYETCWGAVVTTQECIDGMAEAGFDTVRIPVYWGNMMEEDGTYTISSDYMARVQEIVDYCRNAELYAVINVHHFDEFLIKNKEKEEVLNASGIIWKQIAEHFKDYSDYLIFEGYNEALGSSPEGVQLTEEEAYDYVNDMNQVFVETVRSTGGNNKELMLIVSGYWTNIDNTTKDAFLLPEDTAEDRLMVSVHYIDNACYWTNQIGGEKWLDYSIQQCELLKSAFTDRDIPVFVGESTSIYTEDRFAPNATVTESSECLKAILDMAIDYGCVPVLWDVNDNFYSRTECRIKSESDQLVIKDMAERLGS